MTGSLRAEKQIFDSVQGHIGITSTELKIIDTPVFQRLRRISQLSPADLVYPGATHTRFAHSLGAMYTMDQFLTHVTKDGKKLAEKDEDRERLRLAALLHDIGHYPFSHTGQEVIRSRGGPKHEEFGAMVIDKFLKEKFDTFRSSEVTDLILLRKAKSAYSLLLSSDLDADRCDYLPRDSYYTGIAYGQIDVARLIRTLSFEGNDMVFEKGGVAIENFLLGRYHMYQTVYNHKVVTAFELMIQRIYGALIDEGIVPMPSTLLKGASDIPWACCDEGSIYMGMVTYLKKGKDAFCKSLIRMLFERSPVAIAYGDSQSTDRAATPNIHGTISLLMEDKEKKQDLCKAIHSDIPSFKSDWLFPILLEPLDPVPIETPIFVGGKDGVRIPISEDKGTIFREIGTRVLSIARIYTKPGWEVKVGAAFNRWSSEQATPH